MKRLLSALLLITAGCHLIPEKVEMTDERIQPLLEAAAAFDRESYGFSPIPEEADVRFESRPREAYDAMLHIYSKTSRTIAFRKTDEGWEWIGEQESFKGPNKYTSVDGTFYEHITLTYNIENVSGHPTNRLNISYWGEDPRLSHGRDMTLAEVEPVLEEWGY